MAWSTPPDWTNLQVVSEANLDTYLTGNTQHLYDIIHGVVNEALTILGDTTFRDNGAMEVSLQRHDATALGPILAYRKSRGTNAAPTIVLAEDQTGGIDWYGYDGAAYIRAAAMQVNVDGTPGLNDMPGRIGFYTTPDGSATPTERMRINAAGQALISDGSESLPGLGFLNDTNLGLYRVTTDTIGIAATQVLFGTDGSASVPGLSWESDTNTGIFHTASADAFGFSVGGSSVMEFAKPSTAALAFFAGTPATKQTVTGAKGSNAALGSLLTALSNYGLITDSSTA